MWNTLEQATDMLYNDVQSRWMTLLTIHYVAAAPGIEDGKYLPGNSLLAPKFTDATHYDLIMFREQFNQYIDKLIKETLPTDWQE